jgi:[citrate (pro-3S)-lyase] ligase
MNLHSKNFNSEPIAVENEGVCLNKVGDFDILDEKITPKLRDGNIKDGDIVIWLMDKRYSITETDKVSFAFLTVCLEQHGIQVIDLTQTMRIVQRKLAYIDKKHVNHRGYKIVATKLYMDYIKRVIDGNIPVPNRRKLVPADAREHGEGRADEGLTGEQNAEFRKYLEYLQNERGDTRGNIGAIVMNCNPFTRGHRYLVEQASSEVDFLYVFVVEEDKSFFPFADRFKLVSESLSDINNVRVLRSGKFIISTISFPGYFSKDSEKEVAVDTSLDLRLFCKYIVPALGIDARFAGNEPTDLITRQYNKAMKEALPQYGIKFAEFERIAKDGEAISASTVRALLEERDWNGIRTLVPDATYEYLRDKFESAKP